MSDPFDRLRGFDPGVAPPDAEVIRTRAERIRRNRSVGLSAGIAVVLAASVFAVSVNGPGTLGGRVSPTSRESAAQSEGSSGLEAGESASSGSLAASPAAPGPGGATMTSPGAVPAGKAAASPSVQLLRVELELSAERVAPGLPAAFRLRVCNDGSAEVAVSFPTAQRYDFEVASRRTGELVWRWGAGQAFAQETGTERFLPGCRLIGEESWNGTDQSGRPVEPGTYVVTGILTSSEPKRTASKNICSVTC